MTALSHMTENRDRLMVDARADGRTLRTVRAPVRRPSVLWVTPNRHTP